MRLETELWLPAPRDEVFRFFSDALNLEKITPPWLRFRVRTPAPVTIEHGTIIDYQLRLHGLPIRWQSEIVVWDPPRQFVDVQRLGPYRRWVHTHSFSEQQGGTRVADSVDFEVRGGPIVEWLVMRDVRRIFGFRRDTLLKLFT